MSRRSLRCALKVEYAEIDEEPLPKTKKLSVKMGKLSMESPNKAKNEENHSPKTGKGATGLSDYEKQILQNIEERKKMFQELVGDAKKEFMQTVEIPGKEKTKASQRGLKRKSEPWNMGVVEPLRMSLRSRKKEPEFEMDPDITDYKVNVKIERTGPLTLANTNVNEESDGESKKFIESMIPLLEKEGELEKLPGDLQDFLKLMKTFSIREEGVAKVLKSRIYSLAWHPSTCKNLIASGDRDGNLGFWDIDQLDDKHQGVRAYKVHNQPVNCVTFDKFNNTRLLSTSYDGFVRCLDMHTNIFDEVYSIKRTKDTWTAYHAQRDNSTLIVSQSNGDVAIVDVRSKPGRAQNLLQCFEMSCRSVSLHPTDNNLFMVCNRYGESGIFDIRYSGNEDDLAVPVMTIPKSPKGIHGAFFSPITGKYALMTGTDNTLKLYDVQQNKSEAECIKSIDHNNFTGRWLTPFKAIWHPQREDVFLVGSMEHPRRVELYGAPSGKLLHNFSGEFLASVCSINAFHPSLPIFAGGNSSGRVHVFRP